MQLAQREVERALTSKGFERSESHHSYFKYQTVDGRTTSVYTFTSHSNRDLDDYLIGKMAKQLKLNKTQLRELSDCSLTQAAYEAILMAAGHI